MISDHDFAQIVMLGIAPRIRLALVDDDDLDAVDAAESVAV